MKRYWAVILFLLSNPTQAGEWFTQHNQLTETHQYFLQGNESLGFQSMVESWKKQPAPKEKKNLISLLDSVLQYNCGVNLKEKDKQEVIKELKIDRITILS